MFTLFSIIVIGFFLGMRHATDPDHVIAVTTIVTNQRSARRAALIGAFWGLGHTATIFAVGTAIILFNLVIPARLGLSMELSVGFMLIGLGGWNVASFLQSVPRTELSAAGSIPSTHQHPHRHGDYIHSHGDEKPFASLDRRFSNVGWYQFLRPLAVGIVHGLAGSAAVALLILASIRNSTWAIFYLLVFGLGTIAGMMLITMSIASTLRYAGNRFEWFTRRLAMASGLVSIAFGLFLAYQICVEQGLFGANPHWTPR
jgi:ABC-type nickel/cobalt efflux system permease component RcnA